MAALATTNPTLLDFAATLGPDNKVADIIEMVDQENEVTQDAVAIEGNLPTGHMTNVRTGIPMPTWRKLYGGVQPSKSGYAKVVENIGMMENYGEVDKALADLNGNTAAFRLLEDKGIIEGFAQEFTSTLFFGNEVNEPESFTGFAPRFNALTGADNSENVISAGGSGSDLTSIWLVQWGTDSTHLVYPKGSQGGVQSSDKGQVTIENIDGNGGRMEAYRTHYRWDTGLVVRDWRKVVRVCNIPPAIYSDAAGTTSKALVALLIRALERLKNPGAGRTAFYLNGSVRAALRLGMLEKVSAQLTWETIAGKRVLMFDNIPVRRVDALKPTESTVS